MSQLEQLSMRALHHWYRRKGACPEAERAPLPQHLIWQAPFVFPCEGQDEEALRETILTAGRLWLQNLDLRFAKYLIISRTDAEQSYIFRRIQHPGDQAQSSGAIPRRLVTSGGQLYSYPLIYRERE